MSAALLATKLFAPAGRAQAVVRTRLQQPLDATLVAGHRLTLISAPAGFGKTTVLGAWVARLSATEPTARVGWLSLDDADNDLVRFVTHLVAALEMTGLHLDAGLITRPLPGDAPAAMTALLNAVVDADGHQGRPRVLVLDDFHVIKNAEVYGAVTFLLDHLPEQLRVVVATRADPPLPLARLRARGHLLELRGSHLRFTSDEARQFLNEVMGLDLTDGQVEALEHRTEGWIAGLQLAALSVRALPDRQAVTDFIAAFTGSNRFVLDYLADEVLSQQTPAVRQFLLRTSVLDRLTGPLCDAVSGQTGGASVLEELERRNLFVVPLDSERAWYRYHHLFADVLEARLLSDNPEAVPGLHRTASDWFVARGMTGDAVQHALLADDDRHAASLVEAALPEFRRSRQDGLLMTWVRALPPSVIRGNPVLSILSGWSFMMAGDLGEAESRFDDADAALAATARAAHPPAQVPNTQDRRNAPATVLVYRAALAQAHGDVASTVRHAQRALTLAGPDDHFIRGAASGFLGMAAWAAGDLTTAIATFSEAVRSLQAAGNQVDALDATIVLANMWVASGRPSRARALFEDALETALASGGPYPRATADLHVGLAELDLEQDDLPGAERHLDEAHHHAKRGSISENRYRWPMVMAQVRAAQGDYPSAQALLGEAAALYRRGFYPDLRPIDAIRARVRIAAGDLESAAMWVDAAGVSAEDEPAYLHEFAQLTLARLLLARARLGQRPGLLEESSPLDTVLGQLDRMHKTATATGRDGSLAEIRMLQALAHLAGGQLDAAIESLARARAECPEPDSAVRLFLDEAAPMLELLRKVAAMPDGVDDQRDLQAWARQLLLRAEGPDRHRSVQQELVDPLTRREIDVLRLLATEFTGPEIAGQLYVSVNTLRTHTKRIFTKLDVRTRAAAVRSAREHGVI